MGVQLERLVCDEFPCMAVMRYDAGLNASTEHLDPLILQFEDRVGEQASVNSSLWGYEDGSVMVVAFGHEELNADPGVEARMKTRFEELHDQSQAQASPRK